MTPVEQILVESLAQLDALHEPMRDPRASYWAPTWHLRRNYASEGLAYRGSGLKTAERDLATAVAAGLIVRHRGRSKTVGLVLTAAGMAEGRRLIGEHPYAAEIVLAAILGLGPAGFWIPETALSDDGRTGWGDGRSDELKVIQAANRPALAAGLIESNCLTTGGVAYRATGETGAAVPPGGFGLPYPDPDPYAERAYTRAFLESIAWLDSQDDGGRDIGALHLAPWHLLPFKQAGGYVAVESAP